MEPRPDILTPETEALDRTAADVSANGARRARGEDTFWQALGTLFRQRRLILGVTALGAIVSVVIALVLTPWYQATARVILPESRSGGAFGAFFGDIGAAASSLLGIGGGDYVRYLAILDRRDTYEALVDRFNLIDTYDLADAENPHYEAYLTVQDNVEFGIDIEYEYLYVSVLDPDPEQAAAMANFMVDLLNEENARYASQHARQTRLFVEQRYQATVDSLDAIQARMQAFQEEHGVIELEAQVEALLTAIAEARANTVQNQIAYEATLQQYGEDNAQVQSARSLLEAARRQERRFTSGGDQLMPVSFQELPAVARRYAELKRDLLIQATVLEYARPMLEQSIFEEQRVTPAVQVLESAVPPVEKAKPARKLIVIGVTLSVFLVMVVFVLVQAWWRRNHAYFARRLRREAEAAS